MANVDPNVYALNIQIELDAEKAFNILDEFGESISKIEQQIQNVAEAALRGLGAVAAKTEQAVQSVTNVTEAFSTHLGKTVDHADGLAEGAASAAIDIATMAGDLAGVGDTFESIEKNSGFFNGNLRQTKVFIGDIIKSIANKLRLQQQAVKIGSTELDNAAAMNDQLKQVTANVQKKNVKHAEEGEYISAEIAMLSQAFHLTNEHEAAVQRTADAFKSVWRNVTSIVAWLREAGKNTEEFATANFRLYGSQEQLLNQSRMLTSEAGLLQQESRAALVALGNVRVPVDQQYKLAGAIGRVNKITGIQVDTLAEYSKNMRLVGMDSDKQTIAFAKMTEAARKFGLTQQDLSKSVLGSTERMIALNRMLGGDPEQLARFQNMELAVMGIAKQAGLGTDAAQDLMNQFADPEKVLALGGYLGMQIETADDMSIAVGKLGQQLSELEVQAKAGDKAAQLQLKALSEQFAGSEKGGEAAIQTFRAMQEQLDLTGGSIDNAADALAALNRLGRERDFTLERQLALLTEKFYAVTGAILTFIGEGLVPVIWALNGVLYGISWVITAFLGFLQALKKYPVIGLLVSAFQMLVAVSLVLIAGIVGLAGVIGTVAIPVMTGFGIAATGVGTLVAGAGKIMLRVVKVIGSVFIEFMKQLGKGFAALGRQIAPVMLPLLAIGAALFLAGAGAYLFAKAIMLLTSNLKAAAIGALLIIAVLAAVALGLVLLGRLFTDPTLAIGSLVFASVLLLIGLAALAFGAGMYFAAKAVEVLSKSLTWELVGQLAVLGAILLAMGLIVGAAPFIAFGLAILGFALLPLALGLYALAKVMPTVASAMKMFLEVFTQFSGSIYESAKSLMYSAGYLVGAGALGLVAAALLLAAAIPLGVGLAAWGAIGVELIIVAALLWVGAKILKSAARALLAAMVVLEQATEIGLQNSKSMLAMSGILSYISGAIFVAGIGLLIGAGAMLVGALLLGGALIVLGVVAAAALLAAGLIGRGFARIRKAMAQLGPPSEVLQVGMGFSMLASSLKSIGGLYRDGTIRDVGKTFEELSGVGLSLVSTANILSFVAPIINEALMMMASPFMLITQALEGFVTIVNTQLSSAVDTLTSEMERMSSVLESYADRIETVFDRINLAVNKGIEIALPGQIGGEVQSETLSTVRVLTQSIGGDAEADEMAAVAAQQVQILQQIADTLSDDRSEMTDEILQLLKTYLPHLAKRTNLTNAIANWSR